jgi:hypothetical protein
MNTCVFWNMYRNGLWNYLYVSAQSNEHLVYQEARPGLDIQLDEDILREEQVGGFHL